MNKRNKVLQVIAIIICIIAMCGTSINYPVFQGNIEDEPVALSDGMGTLITQTVDDKLIIPDKYNTGAKKILTSVEAGGTVKGIVLKYSKNEQKNIIDFAYGNTDISGEIVIEGYDFSSYPVFTNNEDMVDRKIRLVFKNCKFSNMSKGITNENVFYEFEDCSFNFFYGSNASFDRCAFGGASSDGLVPVQNITVKNCYFSDMVYPNYSGKEIHIDGTQIYGRKSVDVKNINFSNCRFEIPAITLPGSTSYINACIMLQMEFSNAYNMKFERCILNGGGYSLYAHTNTKDLTLSDVSFSDISIGCARTFGIMYPDVDPAVQFDNLHETQSLYVSSVWKDGNKTHLTVTNDTNIERTLSVFTSKGSYDFTIPACPTGNQLSSYTGIDELPTDIDIIIPEDCEYVVCYDNTFNGNANQIRFMNWTNYPVYITNGIINELTDKKGQEYVSGSCGSNVTYTLQNDGTLILEGTGSTYDYHSLSIAPWADYRSFITKIVVGEGISKLGNQIFKDCTALKEILLPEGLTSIGIRTFAGCNCLENISIPSTVEACSKDAFTGTLTSKIYCYPQQYTNFFKDYTVINKVYCVADKQDESQTEVEDYVIKGKCGMNVTFTLNDKGELALHGTGKTYDYHSLKVAPWYDYRLSIKKVIIDEGITNIGNQLFRNCVNVAEVSLPNSIKEIGISSFISCMSLKKIVIPTSVEKISKFAFNGDNLLATYYCGPKDMWDKINIEYRNESILSSIIFQ